MLDELLADLAKKALIENIMQDIGAYIFVGSLAAIMFMGYHICNVAEQKAEMIRSKRKARKNA